MDTTQPPPPSTTTAPPISPPTPTPQLHHSFSPHTTTTNINNHRTKKRSKYLSITIPDVTSTTPSTSSGPNRAMNKPETSAHDMPPPCTECGKVFWSKKALFGHMRCHPERQWRGINPPPNLRRSSPSHATTSSSLKSSYFNDDDREVAQGLLMLATSSSADVDVSSTYTSTSALKFECSCCKKTFGSPQALGGHRASHKNVKGCFANAKNALDVDPMMMEGQNRNNEMFVCGDNDELLDLNLGLGLGHRCGICMRVFSSGQALGGHMRCHWDHLQDQHQQVGLGSGSSSRPRGDQCGLDLNHPAPVIDEGSSSLSMVNVDNDSSNSRSNLRLDLKLGI